MTKTKLLLISFIVKTIVLVHEGDCEKQDVFYDCWPKSLTMWEAFVLSLWSFLVLNDAKFLSLFRHNCVNTYNKLCQEIECKPLLIELEFKLLPLVIQYLAVASIKSSNWASTFLPPLLDVITHIMPHLFATYALASSPNEQRLIWCGEQDHCMECLWKYQVQQ